MQFVGASSPKGLNAAFSWPSDAESAKGIFCNLDEDWRRQRVLSAIAALPASMAEDPGVVCWQMNYALADRNWQQAKGLLEKMKQG
jgi:hypothetical protein